MKHKYHYELYLDRIWKGHLFLYNVMDIVKMPKMLFKAIEIAKSTETYYPEYKRKKLTERILDNFKWVLKNKEANIYYTSYGLDVKDFRDANDFMPYREFKLCREGAHYLYPDKYRFSEQVMLRDKYVFGCYLESALGKQYVPKMIGLMRNGYIELHETHEMISIEKYLSDDCRFFCKLLDGECADVAYLIEVKDGNLFNGGIPLDISEFKSAIKEATMICQEVVEQHPDINKLNPHCVNTIRIITVRGNSGNIHVFAASIRLGVSADSFVDNRAAGGSAVGIDENGKLKKYGFQHSHFGTRLEVHPVTGVRFEGYQLPYWKEITELVVEAHKKIINVQSIGWDVAITPSGPIFIEGNDNWEMPNPQDSHGGLKKRWYSMIYDEVR